jgi:uncharacterized membrane protein (DUF441 family)
MARYRKLVALLVGFGVMFAARRGLDLSGHEAEIVDGIIALGTAAGVYLAKNSDA